MLKKAASGVLASFSSVVNGEMRKMKRRTDEDSFPETFHVSRIVGGLFEHPETTLAPTPYEIYQPRVL